MSDLAPRRLLLRLGAATVGLAGLSGTAVAHGIPGQAGEPVAFAVVVGLPILAGLGGGAIVVRRLRRERAAPAGHRWGVALGVLLAVLGATILASVLAARPWLGVAGAALGAFAVMWGTRGDGAAGHAHDADVAFGAVSAHRLLEGVALGALYSAGAAIGLLAAVLLAGHSAVETAAVGGAYAASPVRLRSVGAILLVQAGYAAGALAGLGLADALPTSVRALVLAAAGGALLAVGGRETRRMLSGEAASPGG